MSTDIDVLKGKASFLLGYIRQVNSIIQSQNLQQICNRYPISANDMTISEIKEFAFITSSICGIILYQNTCGWRWPEEYKDAVSQIKKLAYELETLTMCI